MDSVRTGTCFKAAPISDCRCPSSGLEKSMELVYPASSAKNGEGPVLLLFLSFFSVF